MTSRRWPRTSSVRSSTSVSRGTTCSRQTAIDYVELGGTFGSQLHVPTTFTVVRSDATSFASKDPDTRSTPTVIRPEPRDASATHSRDRVPVSLMLASSGGGAGRSTVPPPVTSAKGAVTMRLYFWAAIVPDRVAVVVVQTAVPSGTSVPSTA